MDTLDQDSYLRLPFFIFAMCAVSTEHAHKLSLASVGDNGGGANKELQIISNRDS